MHSNKQIVRICRLTLAITFVLTGSFFALGQGSSVFASVQTPERRLMGTAQIPSQQSLTAREALQLTLNQYMSRFTPGKDYRITEIHEQDSFAYAVAEWFDPLTDERIPEEGFVPLLAERDKAGRWTSIAPLLVSDDEFNGFLKSLPDSLMDETTKVFVYRSREVPFTTQNFTSHKLPWTYQKTAQLRAKGNCYVNSSGGVSCDNTGHDLQLDFNVEGSGISGDVYASKPGTVVFVKESSNSGACNFNNWRQANMVVVQHSGSEYSWYVHLAYNSVPVSTGQSIGYGTKIGVEGATGFSCGVHLHYMTSTGHGNWTDPNNANDAPWATGISAVDFSESNWDALTVGSWYTSQNTGGDCTNPSPNSDQIGLYTDSNYCGSYKILGVGEYSNPGALGIANDSVSSIKVGGNVKATLCHDDNYAGGCEDFTGDDSDLGNNSIGDNQVSSAKVTYRNICNNPGPNSDQIGLYTDPNYCGSYKILGVGEYSNPGALGIANDSVSSIKVGGNVKATLCRDDNYAGGCEDFTGNDSNLGDNSIGDNQVSSSKVANRNACTNGATYAPLQPNYNWCANEGDTCGFSGQASVAYGANNCYFYQTFTNSVSCSNGVFGDPLVGIGKACHYKITLSPPDAPTLSIPENGSHKPSNYDLTFQWNASARASEYLIEWWGGPYSTMQPCGWSSSTSCHIGTVVPGNTYSWHVKARNGAGESNWSPTWTFTAGGGTGIDCDHVQHTGVILYENIDCHRDISGRTKTFSQPTQWLNLDSNFNDIASSIFVSPGWSVKVYEAASNHFYNGAYGGSWRCIDHSMWNLSIDLYTHINTGQTINDTISSVKVFHNSSCIESRTFYSNGTQDGWVLESMESSTQGGSMNTAAERIWLGDDSADRQYRGILSFNAAALPNDAVITSVTLKFRSVGVQGGNPFTTHGNLLVDVRKGCFTGNCALQLTDFQAAPSKLAVMWFTNNPVNGWYSKMMPQAGLPYINKAGVTQFRLRFAKDDNDDLGADYLAFYSGNYMVYPTFRPQLIIKYYIP